MKWITPERIVIYLSITSAIIGSIWALNTKYINIVNAMETNTCSIANHELRISSLEKYNNKIDKIYDYVVKHKE